MTYINSELAALGADPLALEARALRRRLKISQSEFAAMAGVGKSTIERFELGDMHRSGRSVGEQAATKIRLLLERWRERPPEPRREARGRKPRPANDVVAEEERSAS